MNHSHSNDALKLRLMEASRGGAKVYMKEYADSLEEVVSLLNSSKHRCVSSLIAKDHIDALNALRVSLLYNDITQLSMGDIGEASIFFVDPSRYSNGSGLQVTVPSDRTDIIASAQNGTLSCGLMMSSSDGDNQFYSEVAPLVGSGRLVLKPDRFLIYPTGKLTPEGGKMFETHSTEPLAPIQAWTSQDITSVDTSLRSATDEALEKTNAVPLSAVIDKLLVPYIADVPMSEYCKILEDESEQISSLRVELQSYAQKICAEGSDVNQFRRDVVQPKLDRLERDFKRLTSSSNIRLTGMALGTAVMSVATFASSGVLAAVSGLAGAAGLVGAFKEFGDRHEKVNALNNDPMHLLWRLGRFRD